MNTTVAPPSVRVCDYATLAFALWTLCCLVVVALGGSLQHSMWLFTASGSGCLMLVLLIKPHTRDRGYATGAKHQMRESSIVRGLRIVAPGAALVAVLAWNAGFTVLMWWSIVVPLAVAALAVAVSEKPALKPQREIRTREIGLWLLALGCIALTLISHRWDDDDAFYVNLAVAAVDLDLPLMAGDTLHGIDGLPLLLPVYRFHSFELANAAVASLSGIAAIYVFHWIFAGIGAALVPLAHARLFRLIAPQQWLWAVVVLIALLIGIGETHRWYGNLAFVRMWQGKAFYLAVFLPLIYAYGIAFAIRPSLHSWTLLAAAQVAAVGASSSALWGAPVAALLAIAVASPVSRSGFANFATGALPSVLIVCLGLSAKGEMHQALATLSPESSGNAVSAALTEVLGDGTVAIGAMLALVTGWACWPAGITRRFAIGVPLLIFGVLLNPYLSSWITENVTGPSYWRGLWALPVPILMALTLTAPLQWMTPHRWRKHALTAAWGLVLLLALVWAPRFSAVSQENRVQLAVPHLKVPPVWYQAAGMLNEIAGPHAYVVAPSEINTWLPTFHNHAYPLEVRYYLNRSAGRAEIDLEARRRLIAYASGSSRSDADIAAFRAGLTRFDISAVALTIAEPIAPGRTVLRESGFDNAGTIGPYEIWARTPIR